jgi:hypothetical protein
MNDARQESGQQRQDRRLDALGNFQQAAEAAISAWGQDLTTGQGMSAAWMLRSIISDFRIAAGLLSNSQPAGDPAVPDAPGARIALAAGRLDSAAAPSHGQIIRRPGRPSQPTLRAA